MIKIEGDPELRKQIKFATGKKEELIKYLQEQYTRADSDRRGLIEKCKLWHQQANSRRLRPDAGPQDSNIDMPLTRKRMTQNSSRLKNPILQQPNIYTCKPRNAKEGSRKLSIEVENALDYMTDRFDFREFLDDWIEQFQTFPCGIVKTPFVYIKEKFNRWDEISFEDYEYFNDGSPESKKFTTLERTTEGGPKYYLEVEETVDTKVGCFPEVVPFEDFIVPKGTADVDTASIIFHRIYLNDSELKARINNGMYDDKWDKVPMDKAVGKPNEVRDRLITPIDSGEKNVQSDSTYNLQHCILECYLSFDVDDDGQEEEILVTYHPEKKVLLRADHNGFHSYRRPFITYVYKRVIGSIYGDPLTFALEPLHIANSASINQRLDAASLANTITLFVPPNSNIQRIFARDGLRAQIFESDITPSDIFQFQVKQQFSQLPELEGRFERSADEVAALGPYSFGNEQSERPTASGTITIIEESKQPQYDMLERFRRRLAELAKHMLSRYRQYFPEGFTYYLEELDDEGREVMKRVMLEWPKGVIENDVIIETTASSSQMSKIIRKQEIIGLLDKIPQYQETLMGLAREATDVMNPAAPVAIKLLVGFQSAFDAMLTEMDVPEKEKLNPELPSVIDYSTKIQGVIQQITQERDQLLAALQEISQRFGIPLEMGDQQGQGVPPNAGPQKPEGVQGTMPAPPGPQREGGM